MVASAKVIPAAYAGLGLALLSRAGGAGAWSGGPLIAQGGARFNRSTRVAQPPLATIDNSRYTLAQSVPRAPHCTDTLVIKTHYTRPRTVPTHSLTRHTLPVAREQIPLKPRCVTRVHILPNRHTRPLAPVLRAFREM